VPAPDSSRLLATLAYHGPVSTPTAEILTSLHLAHAGLRAEIARAIHRKKTPELKFHVMRA
jgi:ribosome-binding factor A